MRIRLQWATPCYPLPFGGRSKPAHLGSTFHYRSFPRQRSDAGEESARGEATTTYEYTALRRERRHRTALWPLQVVGPTAWLRRSLSIDPAGVQHLGAVPWEVRANPSMDRISGGLVTKQY